MNNVPNHNQIAESPKPKGIHTVSAVLQDGGILEMLYRPEEAKTGFALWREGVWTYHPELKISESETLIPYSANNNLIKNGVILFPSKPEEYGTEEELLAEIQTYIRQYVDVSPVFEKIASYYVLLSWVYDNFNELPYLRLRGGPGCGKTRFLQTVGALCYKPIFASGASSISPIFRILDSMQGTLIIDESDFRVSDEKAEMVKILNNGNAKGFPVLRSEMSPSTKEFNPRAYQVFGPKMAATRGFFEDVALESRFITEEMGQRRLRFDIPINLPDTYKADALRLRNKLVLFRFRNLGKQPLTNDLVDRAIEPRLNQVFIPLLSIIGDEKVREDIKELAREYNQQMVSDRGLEVEARVLEVIKDLSESSARLTLQAITESFIRLFGHEYERRISVKWMGFNIRSRLGLKTEKSHGVFVIPVSEMPKLNLLYEKYGLILPVHSRPTSPDIPVGSPPSPPSPPVPPKTSP